MLAVETTPEKRIAELEQSVRVLLGNGGDCVHHHAGAYEFWGCRWCGTPYAFDSGRLCDNPYCVAVAVRTTLGDAVTPPREYSGVGVI